MKTKIKVIVPFSGGKDSQASLIWAVKEFGAKNVTAIFCDTDWEHEITPKHIESVVEDLGVELVILRSTKYEGMIDLAEKKKRFPSRKAQFCTEKLKIEPTVDYLLDVVKGDFLIVDGRRRDESESRSKLSENCSYFKHYIQPYGHDKNGRPKTLSYRKKEVMEMVNNGVVNEVIRPFVDKTATDVLEYILQNGQKPNPLYYMGFSRVGCMPCINAKLSEVQLMAEKAPEYIEKVRQAEVKTGRTFFAPNKIPERYCSMKVVSEDGKKVTVPTINDVVNYVKFMNAQTDMFPKGETGRCMSFYNLCE